MAKKKPPPEPEPAPAQTECEHKTRYVHVYHPGLTEIYCECGEWMRNDTN
jgi:hypothetical protein